MARASRFSIPIVLLICALAFHSRASALDLQQSTGTVAGVIADDTGAPVAQATVTLTSDDGAQVQGATGANGRFSLANVPAGSFLLIVAAHGFAEHTMTGRVADGEVEDLPE